LISPTGNNLVNRSDSEAVTVFLGFATDFITGFFIGALFGLVIGLLTTGAGFMVCLTTLGLIIGAGFATTFLTTGFEIGLAAGFTGCFCDPFWAVITN
jgi:hypothetical protein